MPTLTTTEQLLELVRKSGVVEEVLLNAYLDKARAAGKLSGAAVPDASVLVRDGILTPFQAHQLLEGKSRRFVLGNYKVLDHLGSGGMGHVFLCEHRFMRRRAALKILPRSKASDPAALERFYREARAVAALDHPNIVRAYDIAQQDDLYFLAMEYVEGGDLDNLVKQSGPLDPSRVADYISQAASGLQHAHEVAGLVHRDIKPANLIVNCQGTLKILDLGLARFFEDKESRLTIQNDQNLLGTADYLAPEQALDSHGADIRADIYSLGATFYFCLTGRAPFGQASTVQKLIWHQTRKPRPIESFRNDVPRAMLAVVEKMMAKEPSDRYQLPLEVIQALAPWCKAHQLPAQDSRKPWTEPLSSPHSEPEADFPFITRELKLSWPDDDLVKLEKDTAESAALDDTEPTRKKSGGRSGTRLRSAWPSYGLDHRRTWVVVGIVAGVMVLLLLLFSLLAFLGD
jgi:serine/threonine protein kinase